MEETKHCPSCSKDLPKTEEYFYPNRKKERKSVGWQSYCKNCWPIINKSNKEARKRTFTYA